MTCSHSQMHIEHAALPLFGLHMRVEPLLYA